MTKKNKFTLLFFLSLFCGSILEAHRIDHSIVQNCVFNLTTTHRTDIFLGCLNSSEIHSSIPASCYHAKAASKSFNSAIYIGVSVFILSIFVIPFIHGGFEIASQRLACCKPTQTGDTKRDSIGKIFIGKLMDSVNALTTAAISCVTISWIYALWNSESSSKASCDFESNPLDADG